MSVIGVQDFNQANGIRKEKTTHRVQDCIPAFEIHSNTRDPLVIVLENKNVIRQCPRLELHQRIESDEMPI
ncbi:hypothetical protein MJO28_015526 [Puccinia striiformis f. sp. tritici]|uniref:Uncharacterized protein n=1 Tax=Puccinia striiformis f. sp. tritici TaxID=168172 RepID=A0ACC0DQ08_9BASI|nr:hypothetical protein MJO28_015526 [Puccinia striiformis f. sp. tritici]